MAHTIPIPGPATSRQLDNGKGRVRRISLRETSGAASAVLQLYDGSGTNGALVDTISLSAGQSTRDYYRHDEYPFHGGLWLQVVSGTFEGTVVVVHDDDPSWWGLPVVIIEIPSP